MAQREFIDSKRTTWTVWDVYPTLGDRRGPFADRRHFLRETVERRAITASSLRVSPEFAGGWLAFQAGEERRRLAPIPIDWEAATPSQLEQLCAAATPVGRPRRLPLA
jgi:hypothetical protein